MRQLLSTISDIVIITKSKVIYKKTRLENIYLNGIFEHHEELLEKMGLDSKPAISMMVFVSDNSSELLDENGQITPKALEDYAPGAASYFAWCRDQISDHIESIKTLDRYEQEESIKTFIKTQIKLSDYFNSGYGVEDQFMEEHGKLKEERERD